MTAFFEMCSFDAPTVSNSGKRDNGKIDRIQCRQMTTRITEEKQTEDQVADKEENSPRIGRNGRGFFIHFLQCQQSRVLLLLHSSAYNRPTHGFLRKLRSGTAQEGESVE